MKPVQNNGRGAMTVTKHLTSILGRTREDDVVGRTVDSVRIRKDWCHATRDVITREDLARY